MLMISRVSLNDTSEAEEVFSRIRPGTNNAQKQIMLKD